MKRVKIWAVTGHSESGDDYGPELFSVKPSETILKKLAHSWDGVWEDDDETYEEGPGSYGSYVALELTPCYLDSFKQELNKTKGKNK